MIAQIEGTLIRLGADCGLVKVGPICYEIHLPGYAVKDLGGRIGQEITLCTLEYIEGSPAGGNMVPRLVGFLSEAEKEFFAKYTSVKGMGVRKGLKSLSIPIATIADAVEAGDEKLLQTLPGVGKRFAQLIIAELKGKLAGFAAGAAGPAAPAPAFAPYQLQALEVLIAWGERRAEAVELVALACRRHPEVRTAEELVPLVYRMKQGVEV